MNEFPDENTFAVIRMDPVAMVQHLDDPEALRAAQALYPRSYLVYLERHHPLPIWGSKPWHGFTVHPIGQSLRTTNEAECLTPEMCTPIFPNDKHPGGREPIRTEPPFPFDNCLIWSRAGMNIRVCPRAEGFDLDAATRLPISPLYERERWIAYSIEDRARQEAAQQARESQLHADSESSSSSAAPPRADDDTSSGTSVYSCSIIASTDSVDTQTELARRFADPEESPELHPLCHLWCDVAANLRQDEIPSPVHLFEERDAIVRIIREARARDPTLPLLPVPNVYGSTWTLSSLNSPEGSDAEPDSVSITHLKPRRFRPLKSLRKVGLRIQSLFRKPHIAVWA